MIYYRRYIGSYQKRTARLSMRDHGAYGLMLDYYYAEELPLPLEREDIYDICKARTPDDVKSVDKVLKLFFKKGDDGYHNGRADDEIAASQKARTNGKLGGRPPKTDSGTETVTEEESETEPGGEPGTEPEHKPTETEKATGTVHPTAFQPFSPSALDLSTAQPSTDSPAENPNANPPPNRAAAIAILIRNLEKTRNKAPKVTSIDPRVQAWAKAGVTDGEVREAHALAVADREVSGEDAAINAGFLDVFIAKVRTPGNGASRVSRSPVSSDWWATDAGIVAKAIELGIRGDDPYALKCEIAAAIGGDTWPWIDPRNDTQQRLIREARERSAA